MSFAVLSACLVAMTGAVTEAAGSGGPEAGRGPLEPRVHQVLERVTPSVVSLWSGGANGPHVTGTIITPNGLIATCADMSAKVGEPVEVHFADGRKAEGKVLAKLDFEGKPIGSQDIALVRLVGKGPWAAIEVGTAAGIRDDDPLLAVGFGSTGLYGGPGTEPPYCVRIGRRVGALPPPDVVLVTTVSGTGGDSGSPLFTLVGGSSASRHSPRPTAGSAATRRPTRSVGRGKTWLGESRRFRPPSWGARRRSRLRRRRLTPSVRSGQRLSRCCQTTAGPPSE